jgi:hypothetical protein
MNRNDEIARRTGIRQAPPDFIVCGGVGEDGRVYLTASRELKAAMLEKTSEYEHLHGPFAPPSEIAHNINISADMHGYVVIAADTYPEAWQGLFNYWEQEDAAARRAKIESGMRAIDG